ncbi:MAG: DNA topoisomerase III [Opitutae bacterium]|nr:DNA topoisomerase III [Opitutae bacterium]
MKQLIIAEKPSVATDLAKAIGVNSKTNDHFENDTTIISSALGHLVELFMPDDFDKNLKTWRLRNLPIIPDQFQLKPITKTRKKFQDLKKLMGRKDVGEVVNACDAGREGELIFTYLYEAAKCQKPIKRMWMSSMTQGSIRQAYDGLRDKDSMQPLQDAARCRSEADWLIGINGTRAVTLKKSRGKARQMTTVGRVQTPTLSLVVSREREIVNFNPQKFWRLSGRFKIAEGEYEGQCQKENFKKNQANPHDRVDRFWDQEEATKLHQKLSDPSQAAVTETKKRKPEQPGRLFDLTTLQRTANSRLKYSASRTLQIAQSLYERHKVITYPRTDSKALPEDYADTCDDVLANLAGDLAPFAAKVRENGWVNPSDKKVFNDKQVSDHFAIIPTDQAPSGLSSDEAKIYSLIAKRFVAIFYPPAQWDVTTRFSEIDGHQFKTTGNTLVEASWLEIYGKEGGGDSTLPALRSADGNPPEAAIVGIDLIEEETKPPARFNEATLLSSMENAGKHVDDEEIAEAMKEKGLGTPATRAATIEHLIREEYLKREKRTLFPTGKAEALIDFLVAVGAESLTSPSMTGEWESRLRLMEEGKLTRDEFMKGIVEVTRDMVQRTAGFKEDESDLQETSLTSPIDGTPLYEGLAYYQSRDGSFRVNKTMGNRRIAINECEELIKQGKVGPLEGFRSKAGKPFSAIIKLDEDNRAVFVFDNPASGEGEPTNAKELGECPVLGKCPSCGGQIHQTPNAFICEKHAQVAKKGSCTVRVTRKLLEKDIPSEEFAKMLDAGKTNLISGFRSRKTRKLFDAFLTLDNKGRLRFEFPPREPKAPAASKK